MYQAGKAGEVHTHSYHTVTMAETCISRRHIQCKWAQGLQSETLRRGHLYRYLEGTENEVRRLLPSFQSRH